MECEYTCYQKLLQLPGLETPKRQTTSADIFSSERAAARLQLISDLCDFTTPASALSWIDFDDGIVGLAGTVSSLIGVYSTWKKTA